MLIATAKKRGYISQEEIFRKGPVKGLEDAIFEIATLAHDHLLTARTFLQNIPNQALPALLSAVTSFFFVIIFLDLYKHVN